VHAISTASAEQAHSIDEVSQAVANMDGMTREGASLAEDAASSAAALSSNIAKLDQLIAGFKTGAAASVARRMPAADAAPTSEPDRLRKLASAAMGLLRRPGKAAAKAQPAPVRATQIVAKRVANGRDEDWDEF
jgi:hypothetical protein